MNKKVVIVGASGHGKVVADIVRKLGDRIIGFLDDDLSLPDTFIGFPLLGSVNSYEKFDAEFVVAIGDSAIREKITGYMKKADWYTAIHPSAVVAESVKIGKGTVIMANAVVNPASIIGRHCIINSSAVIEHDDEISDFVHVSVGAKLAGNVHVGKRTWIGIGATVSNNINICDNCMIGAGAVVINNIVVPGTYVGIPARRVVAKNIGGGYSGELIFALPPTINEVAA